MVKYTNIFLEVFNTKIPLCRRINQELDILNISPKQLIAQCYDGASVISGKIVGVKAKIQNMFPYAHYVYCYTHQLNLIVEKSESESREVKMFFSNLHTFPKFYSRSSNRHFK